MKHDAHIRRLLQRRRRVARRMPPLEQVIRGTLAQRYVRCGKPGCHCRKGRGHGPVRYLTVSLGVGRTQQVTIGRDDWQAVRKLVRNYQRLWQLLEQISAINRELLKRRSLPTTAPTSGRSRSRRSRGGKLPDQ